ncbi:MAG: hypothetical protein K1060chlam5_01094 [Candidatus Anoxychlamydiales bacterium]|nr:hypothetical protein [Candidatus Anoxychlamydiales bacterium]
MLKFLLSFIFFLVVGGLLLHYKVDLPYLFAWIGKLPGDFIAKKDTTIFYFPITSAAGVAIVISTFFSSFKKNKN